MLKGRELLICLNEKYEGNWEKIYKAVADREVPDEDEVYQIMLNIDTSKFVTLVDDDYPQEIKNIYRPPFVIYKCDLELFLRNYKFIENLINR